MREGTALPSVHGETDARRNSEKIRRVLMYFGAATLVAAVLVCLSLIWRDATHMHNPNEQASQWITIAVTLVWGALMIFFGDMKLSPLLSYRRYLREIHSGISRELEGAVVECDSGLTYREGLDFYRLVVNVGDLAEPEDERVLYWDAQLGAPPLAVGDRAFVRAHGNDIIAMKKL